MMIPINVNQQPMSICSKCKEQHPSFVHPSYCIKCTREQDGRTAARSSFQYNDDETASSRDYSLVPLPTSIVTLRMRPRRWEESPEIQAATILSSFRREGDDIITEELFDVSTPTKVMHTPTTTEFMTPFPQRHSSVWSSPPPIHRENRNTIISLGFSSPSSSLTSSSSTSTSLISSPIPPRLLLPEL